MKKVASSESLNFSLTIKTEELVKINTYVKALEAQNIEVKDIVHKGNSQKAQIKIKYDNLIKIIADKDNEITLQTKQIQELKALVEWPGGETGLEGGERGGMEEWGRREEIRIMICTCTRSIVFE